MTLLLLVVAAVAAAVYVILSLIRGSRRSGRLGVPDGLLLSLSVLLPVVALLAEDWSAPDPQVEQAARALGGGLIAAGLILAVIELSRRTRLRWSRGVPGLAAGLLLVAASFGVPFIAAWLELAAVEPAEITATAAPAESTLEVEGVISVERVQVEQLFRAIWQLLAEEINVDAVEVFTQLDAGVPLAAIVEQHGGNLAEMQTRLSGLLRAAVRDSAERGEISRLQGALLISQMDLFVHLAVRSDLNSFRGFGGPTPTGTQPSLLILLTEAPLQQPSLPAATAAAAPIATAGPTRAP